MCDEDQDKIQPHDLINYLNARELLPGFYWFRWKTSTLIKAMGAKQVEAMTGKGSRWILKIDERALIYVLGIRGPFYPGPEMLAFLKDIDVEGRIEEPK